MLLRAESLFVRRTVQEQTRQFGRWPDVEVVRATLTHVKAWMRQLEFESQNATMEEAAMLTYLNPEELR